MDADLMQYLEAMEARLKADFHEQLERVETRLLTEFHKWASPADARLRTHSAALRAVDLEMEALTDRLKRIEDKNPPAV